MSTPKGNLPKGPARWLVSRAVLEFAASRETIRAGLARDGVKPGDDNCYSTKQILAAIYGDLRGEQLRRLREDADNIALRNKALRTELVPLGEVQSAVAAVLSSIEQVLLASKLSADEKESMVKHVRGYHYSPSSSGPKLIRAPSIG
jgi:hypothetical protein